MLRDDPRRDLPEDLRLKKTVGRLATYLQGYGDLLVRHERLGPGRAGAVPQPTRWWRRFPGAIDDKADTATLEHIATLLPDEWLEPAATGSAADSAPSACCASSTSASTA